MTNQEAISVLESINAKTDYFLINDDARAEAIDMAIAALQARDLQSTCNQLATDTISRQAAIDTIVTWLKDRMTDGKNGKPLTDRIKDLPSAQPDLTYIIFETLAECGIYGEEATIKLIGTLKRLGRSDLLPPCVR